MRVHRRRRQGGFTLIELMISLVLFSFVIAGVLAVAVAMAAGFREQKVTIGAESSGRAVMEFLGEAVRGASPGVPTGARTVTAGVPFGDIVFLDDDSGATNCAQGAVEVINSSTGPDQLRLVFAYGSISTSTTQAMTEASTTLDVVDVTGFAPDDLILVTNYVQGHIAKVASVAGNTLSLEPWNCSPVTSTFTYPPSSVVIRVARAHFSISNLDGVPTLWMDPDAEGPLGPEPMAEGIEDLQVEIGVDLDGDGQLDLDGSGTEWIHDVAGEVMPVGTPRALRISLLARAVGRLSGIGTALPPVLGDRAAWGTADNFRRRVLTSTIEIRNLEGSK